MVIINTAICLLGFAVVYSTASCPTTSNVITTKNIQDAAHASNKIYDDNLLEGHTIPGTSFRVTKIFHDELQEDGEGIRVMVADYGNIRMIIYRGTDGFEQLLAEGASVLGDEIEWTVDGVKTEVVKFFFQAYRLASFQLRPYIADPSKHYILTGHSLGGALASILALDSTQLFEGSVWKNPKSSLITFGQPRVGGSNYAMVHDRLISTFRKLRVVHKSDPVTGIPLYTYGWRHHSRALYIGTTLVYTGFGRKKRSLYRNSKMVNSRLESIQFDSEIVNKGHLIDYDLERFNSQRNDYFREFNDEMNDGKISKRFLYTSTPYWQVCGSGDHSSCVSHLHNALPNPSDHSMQGYVDSVDNPPSRIYTRKETNKSSFEQAFIGTCLNQ